MLALKDVVDKVGLRNVLYALAHICFIEGEELREHGADRIAVAWEQQGARINAFANETIEGVQEQYAQ